MADGDVKDYAGEKKKPSMALIITVGPKMPKKPEDTSKPDEARKKAWNVVVESNGTYEISKDEGDMLDDFEADRQKLKEYYQSILPQHPDRRKPITKSFDILKIRSAAPPRKPNPVRMRRQAEPEPEPEMMPEPEEPEEDPEMKRRAMQAVMDKINSVRRQRDKFDEEQEVVPTSMEEMTDSLKDVDLSYFLKPPEER